MVAMAEGDHSAVFTLVDEFGDQIAAMVRSQLASYGRRDLLRDRDEMVGLVHTAAFEILDRAGSWDPAGAPPWVWAGHAIRAAVAQQIGHPLADIDVDRLVERQALMPFSRSGPDRADLDDHRDLDLDRLAERHPQVRLLLDALSVTASERDQVVVGQFLIQKAFGDPSPSHTVAAECGLSPANVRQIVSRLRRKLQAMAAHDARYRGLGRSGWLAA